MIPVWTFNRNTGLEISRTEKKVRFIPLDVTELMRVHETSVAKFDSEWQPIPGYDPEKAVAHFKRMGTQYGALKEVCRLLGIAYVPRAESEEPEKPSPKVEAAKPPVKKKLSCGARFIELIMLNKHTDQEIFDIVKAEFDMSDDKSGYVRWYRKHLVAQGKNPPPSLGEIPCKRGKRKETTETSTQPNSAKTATAKPSTGTTRRTSGAGASPVASSPAKTTSSRLAAVKTARSAKSSPAVPPRMSTPTSASISTSSSQVAAKGSRSSASSTSSKIGKSSPKK